MKISIGIDISKKKCDYCVINGRGAVMVTMAAAL